MKDFIGLIIVFMVGKKESAFLNAALKKLFDVQKTNEMSRETGIFKVVGLSAPSSFTLFEQNDHCWAKSGLSEGRYKELFNLAKNDDDFWKQDVKAVVEHDGLGFHGAPINGIVVEININ